MSEKERQYRNLPQIGKRASVSTRAAASASAAMPTGSPDQDRRLVAPRTADEPPPRACAPVVGYAAASAAGREWAHEILPGADAAAAGLRHRPRTVRRRRVSEAVAGTGFRRSGSATGRNRTIEDAERRKRAALPEGARMRPRSATQAPNNPSQPTRPCRFATAEQCIDDPLRVEPAATHGVELRH
jgi:hypothetical protein